MRVMCIRQEQDVTFARGPGFEPLCDAIALSSWFSILRLLLQRQKRFGQIR